MGGRLWPSVMTAVVSMVVVAVAGVMVGDGCGQLTLPFPGQEPGHNEEHYLSHWNHGACDDGARQRAQSPLCGNLTHQTATIRHPDRRRCALARCIVAGTVVPS